MSSFTISITVCGLDQPCSSARGLNTRSFGVPLANCAREGQVRHGRAVEVLGRALGEVLGIDLVVVVRR